MSIEHTIARPYARAIFEIATENNTIQNWKDILIFLNRIASHSKFKNLLSGALSPKYLSLIFITISSDVIDQNVKNLIKLLAYNQRFKFLNNILEHFLKLEAEYNNVIIIELKTAFSLKKEQVIKIQKVLEKSLSKKIQFIYKIDCRIINGIILKINDTVFNLSIQNYLKQLSHALNF